MDEGVDSGPILAQAPVPVADDDDEATLHELAFGLSGALWYRADVLRYGENPHQRGALYARPRPGTASQRFVILAY